MKHAPILAPAPVLALLLAPVLALVSAALPACGNLPLIPAQPADHWSGEVASFDGLPLAVEARGRGTPALVFVHGWMCRASYWEPQLAAFAPSHRVVALDLAGHGASGHERERWDIPTLARDVQAVVEQLDLHEVILVGHSMGGPVSLVAAAAMPERVIGVIGVDTLHDVEYEWDPEFMASFMDSMEADFASTMQGFIGAMFSDPELTLAQRLSADMLEANQRVGMGLMRSYESLDMSALLGASPVPVICINAAEPNPTRRDTNRKYLVSFDVVIMEDVGHFLMMEVPEKFNEQLLATIARFRQR
jgi:sigma-B regulation protein RsbQ